MWAVFLICIPEVGIVEKIEVGNGLKSKDLLVH